MIIAIANQKGGVGKTTTTLNLGVYLAEAGHKTLIIDFDPQANLTSGCGLQITPDESTIYNALIDQIPLAELIRQVPNTKLDIVPASLNLAGAEVELVNTMSRETVLAELIKPIAKQYEVILVDCPPSLGLLTINVLSAADGVLIPVQSEYYALEGLSQLTKTINLVKSKLNPKLKLLGIAITMFDVRTNLAKDVAKELVTTFGHIVFQTVIPRNIRLSEAPSHGEPINLYEPNSVGAHSYSNLATELWKRIS